MTTEKHLEITLQKDQWQHEARLDEAMPDLRLKYQTPHSKVFYVPVEGKNIEVAQALLDELGIHYEIDDVILPGSQMFLHEEDEDDSL